MKKIKLAGVVVLYNPDVDYNNNIKSYIDDLDYLYVIDNSKKENKVLDNKKIKYIFNNANIGVAKALNDAAKLARLDNCDYLLTMDQDTNFNPGVLKEMKKYILENDMSDIGIVTPWHNTKLDEVKSKDDIDYPLTVMTSANIVNLDILDKIGGYNEDYFIDGIDLEYCLRLKKNNYKIVRLNYIEVLHNLGDIKYHNFFGKRILTTNHNYIRMYYILRNYNYIKRDYYDIDKEYCEPLNHLKLRLFRVIMYEKDKFKKIRNMFRGIKDYKKGIVGKYPYNN